MQRRRVSLVVPLLLSFTCSSALAFETAAPPRPGDVSETANGARFVRVGVHGVGGWRDDAGITWLDPVTDDVDKRGAEAFCASLAASIPAADDFERLSMYMG